MTTSPGPGGLAGRIALVTGGSRGVGRAIALRLAAEGAFVAVNYHSNADAAADVVRRIAGSGGRGLAIGASVEGEGSAQRMVEEIARAVGPVDLLVSNAGSSSSGRRVADTPDEEFQRLLDVHALGPVRLAKAVLPGMRDADRGDIVFVSSAFVSSAPSHSAPYTMAKAAAEAAARTLAREERRHGIRVNIVAPGLVATDMGRALVEKVGAGTIDELDERAPFGRVCRPDDVAGVVAMLCSADASYVTGQRIQVDGGGSAEAAF